MEQEDKNKTADELKTQPEGNQAPTEESQIPAEEKIALTTPESSHAVKSARKSSYKKEADSRKKIEKTESEYIEKVLSIRRVTKVTKGGKKLSFSALVVVGDGKSQVGYGQEKAAEVAIAIRKAMATAKKNMIKISLRGTTIPHQIVGVWGGASVLLKPAGEGTGVIASGPVRAVCEGAGIHNILTKCHRSNNPVNVVKATMWGLTNMKSSKS